MKTKKLLLFDVDYTLLDIVKPHKEAFGHAFKKVLGVDVDIGHWPFFGYTDLQIIRTFAKRHNLKLDDGQIKEIMNAMIDDFSKADLSKGIVMPGVREIIEKLSKDGSVILGLVTGNIEEIAHIKLKHFDLDKYFVLGGFGHRSTVRKELVDMAVEQAEKEFGNINKSSVFVIGDTPKDVSAAKEAGVKCIAVATGRHSKEQLKDADHVLDDLSDTKQVMEIIER